MDELGIYLGSRVHRACSWLDGCDGEVGKNQACL